jgi:arylsulfatase A-like enzyme
MTLALCVATMLSCTWVGCARQPESEIDSEPEAALTPLQAEPHPVIIFDIDTLRADRLGCYGNPRPTSPVIDSLAAEGVLFEWTFSQAPTTPPSQASILTSLYPSTHGVKGRKDRLAKEITTLGEVFSDHGFATGAFVDGGYMNRGFGLLQGFKTKVDRRGGLEVIGPKALEWMREHADENFLLLIHTYDVHTPYDPPEPWRSQFLEGVPAPTPGFEPTALVMETIRQSGDTDQPLTLPENDVAYALALYDAGIRYVDDWIGKFVSELESLGIYDRTTLVVISDHGEEFQEHGSVLHEKLYSTVTRVPLIIRSPMALAGSQVSDVVETIDLMPTLLELVGAPVPEQAQGRSTVPLLRGGSLEPKSAFSESRFFGRQRAVTGPTERMIFSQDSGRLELYQYRRDIEEQEDLASRDPNAVSGFKSELSDWFDLVKSSEVAASDYGELDPEVEEQLRALGYLD